MKSCKKILKDLFLLENEMNPDIYQHLILLLSEEMKLDRKEKKRKVKTKKFKVEKKEI